MQRPFAILGLAALILTQSRGARISVGAGMAAILYLALRRRWADKRGLRIALDQIDAVITLIRASKSTAEAKTGLMTNFALSDIQSQAILDMQLQRLTGLERQKILDELAELISLIERLRTILGSQTLLLKIVVDEMRAAQAKFSDPRRTTTCSRRCRATSRKPRRAAAP